MEKRTLAIVISGFFTVSIAFSIRYGYGMLLPEMLPVLRISKMEAGGIYSAYFLIYTLFTPVLGAVSDKFDNRRILTIFPILLGLGAFFMAYSSSFLEASLFFALAGFGHAACWAPVVALVQKWVPEEKKGRILSIVSAGVGTGIFFWGLTLPVIVSKAGWQVGWIALGITAAVTAILNFLLVSNPEIESQSKSPSKSNHQGFYSSYLAIFKRPVFWAIGLSYLLVGASVIVIFTFLPIYARESLNAAYSISTSYISIIALFGIVGQMTLGISSDKIGRGYSLLICSLFLSAASFLVLLSDSVFTLYFYAAIYGIGYGAVWPIYAATASDLFPKQFSGGVIGAWTVFLGIGSILAPAFCGWLVDISVSYNGVFLTSGIVSILSIGLLIPTLKSFGSNG